MKKPDSDVLNKQIKIWGVIEGPFSVRDVYPDTNINIPEEVHFNLCKVERSGKIEYQDLFFEDFNSAHDMVKYFKANIEPIEMEDDGEYDEECH